MALEENKNRSHGKQICRMKNTNNVRILLGMFDTANYKVENYYAFRFPEE